MIAGGTPGHWRRTTGRQRVILYTIVAILSALMTTGLYWVWNWLAREHNADSYHESWDRFEAPAWEKGENE